MTSPSTNRKQERRTSAPPARKVKYSTCCPTDRGGNDSQRVTVSVQLKPATPEVVRRALMAATDEMARALRRACFGNDSVRMARMRRLA